MYNSLKRLKTFLKIRSRCHLYLEDYLAHELALLYLQQKAVTLIN